jgi:hypothetical protein
LQENPTQESNTQAPVRRQHVAVETMAQQVSHALDNSNLTLVYETLDN